MPAALQRALVRPTALLRLTADRESYREYMRLRSSDAPAEGEVELRIGRLAGRSVWVREGTDDVDQLWRVFIDSDHLPPAKVQRRGLPRVWDLGCGIGLTTAEMALRWPEAHVVGVERDRGEARIARRNVEPWDDRTQVVEAEVTADFLNGLAAEPAAYVKMSLDGGERELLGDGADWAAEVGCIKVYVHGDYTRDECARDLARLGFEAGADRRHEHAVLGLR